MQGSYVDMKETFRPRKKNPEKKYVKQDDIIKHKKRVHRHEDDAK